ncbi:hypothetical protein GCM10022247_00200 [Allokutzneria multivorans]|uniref:Uncharacterized protein n=1 Tax=Allokutzneria multivorans TaxID=1142134 RepID=A0ABP7QNU7_9PSEU
MKDAPRKWIVTSVRFCRMNTNRKMSTTIATTTATQVPLIRVGRALPDGLDALVPGPGTGGATGPGTGTGSVGMWSVGI